MTDKKAGTHAQRIYQSLKDSESRPLTTNDIVDALGEKGIETLPDLVARLLELRKARSATKSPSLAAQAIISRTQAEGPAIVHQVPKVPVFIDGVEYDPAHITRFNGTALHFVVVGPDPKQLVLLGFTNEVCLNMFKTSYLASLMPNDFMMPGGSGNIPLPSCQGGTYPPCPPPMPPKPAAPPFNSGQIQMFSDSNYQGDWFYLGTGQAWTDLTKVDRNTFLIWSSDWNDVISSLAGTDTCVTYYEHINYGGSSLTIGPNQPVDDLACMGWNDRISSVANWGSCVH